MTHKQVIVIRKDLKMDLGKGGAMVAHASTGVVVNQAKTRIGLNDSRIKPWLDGSFKKVCLRVDSEEELLEITEAAKKAGLLHCLITDSGLTKFHGIPTKTCVAIGPDTEANVDKVTGHLKLY
jgi:peptidyl-tRNA hydrolase, PTH2 family